MAGYDLHLGSAWAGSASSHRAEQPGATRLLGGLGLHLLLLQVGLPHPLGLRDRVAGDLHDQKTESVSEGC